MSDIYTLRGVLHVSCSRTLPPCTYWGAQLSLGHAAEPQMPGGKQWQLN